MTEEQRSAIRALQESMDLRDNGGEATEPTPEVPLHP
jgi:hypothetical protein